MIADQVQAIVGSRPSAKRHPENVASGTGATLLPAKLLRGFSAFGLFQLWQSAGAISAETRLL